MAVVIGLAVGLILAGLLCVFLSKSLGGFLGVVAWWIGVVLFVVGAILLVTPVLIWVNAQLRSALAL